MHIHEVCTPCVDGHLRWPLARRASFLGSLCARPSGGPRVCAAIQRREPNMPCSNAGIYTSASSLGQCRPSPDGLISISASCSGEALAKPSVSDGGNVSSRPVLRPTTMRAYGNRTYGYGVAGLPPRPPTLLRLRKFLFINGHGSFSIPRTGQQPCRPARPRSGPLENG